MNSHAFLVLPSEINSNCVSKQYVEETLRVQQNYPAAFDYNMKNKIINLKKREMGGGFRLLQFSWFAAVCEKTVLK